MPITCSDENNSLILTTVTKLWEELSDSPWPRNLVSIEWWICRWETYSNRQLCWSWNSRKHLWVWDISVSIACARIGLLGCSVWKDVLPYYRIREPAHRLHQCPCINFILRWNILSPKYLTDQNKARRAVRRKPYRDPKRSEQSFHCFEGQLLSTQCCKYRINGFNM